MTEPYRYRIAPFSDPPASAVNVVAGEPLFPFVDEEGNPGFYRRFDPRPAPDHYYTVCRAVVASRETPTVEERALRFINAAHPALRAVPRDLALVPRRFWRQFLCAGCGRYFVEDPDDACVHCEDDYRAGMEMLRA